MSPTAKAMMPSRCRGGHGWCLARGIHHRFANSKRFATFLAGSVSGATFLARSVSGGTFLAGSVSGGTFLVGSVSGGRREGGGRRKGEGCDTL
jgi:hypothetical protein